MRFLFISLLSLIPFVTTAKEPLPNIPEENTKHLRGQEPSQTLPSTRGEEPEPAAKPPPGQASRLNILFICTDDLRPMLGCYGDPIALTPNIDRLATRATLFNRAYCQASQCGPSRVSFLTGLRPETTRTFSLGDHFDWDRSKHPNLVTLPQHFKNHGYHALALGKIHHDGREDALSWSLPPSPGREREMWELVDEQAVAQLPFKKRNTVPTLIAPREDCPAWQAPEVPDDTLYAGRMTTEAIATLSELKEKNQPFFLGVGYRRPHLPFVAPKKYFDLYPKSAALLPPSEHRTPPENAPVVAYYNTSSYAPKPGKPSRWDPAPSRRVDSREEAIQWSGFELRSYNNIPNKGIFDDDLVISLRQAYLACISYVDAQVGLLLDALDREGLADNTVVVLTSDHGWHLGEHATWCKMTNYEWDTRVPLIIAAPAATHPEISPAKSDGLAELVDVFPTLCDLAGLPQPAHLEGSSLVPLMKNPQHQGWDANNPAFSQFPRRHWAMGRAIRTGRYRYVEWRDEKTNALFARELYDHQNDPAETQNLAHREELADTIVRLSKKLQHINPPLPSL